MEPDAPPELKLPPDRTKSLESSSPLMKPPVSRLSLHLPPGKKKQPPRLPTQRDSSPRRPGLQLNTAQQSTNGPRSPRRRAIQPVNSTDPLQVKQMEHMKERMGTLTFGDKVYHLQNISDITDIIKIGNGISGEVYRLTHKASGITMAAKKMVWLDNHEERKRILMDLNVMTTHKSPNIVRCFGSVIWHNEVWVFMELMATCLDRTLKRLKAPFPEEIVCKIVVSMVKALDYLKTQHKVIHRDIKPSNVLLDMEGNIKLCDFGISGRLVDSQAFTRNAGCAAYMAPERINLQPDKPGYDVRADVWSLGITLVELATGAPPYSDASFKTEFQLLTYIVHAAPPMPDSSKFSPEFYDFLSKCLTKEVTERPQYPELLQHALIKKYEKEEVDVGAWFRGVVSRLGHP